jgi:Tol biopolymer transport system component/class 3 adenylate cyclase
MDTIGINSLGSPLALHSPIGSAADGDRLLCAIVFIDTVASVAAMAADEPRTAAIVKRQNDFAGQLVADTGGRVVRIRGDGMLILFGTGLEAVRFAQELQTSLPQHEDHMRLRIGIHIGDVVFQEDGDVYGADVNYASRIEPEAPPDGICVSSVVWSNIKAQPDLKARSIGLKNLKGVEGPAELFVLTDQSSPGIPHKLKAVSYRYLIAAGAAIAVGIVAYIIITWSVFPPEFGRPLKMTRDPGLEEVPVWSGDGTRIAYTEVSESGTDVYVQQVSTTRSPNGPKVKLTTEHSGPARNPSWSPDDSHIAYTALVDSTWGVYTMSSLGGSSRFVAEVGPVGLLSSATWTVDDQELVFAVGDGSYSRLYRSRVDSPSVERVTPDDGPPFQFHPAVSPDGKWLAYNGSLGRFSSNVDIWVITTGQDDVEPRRLTEETSRNLKPMWSHDGQHIWFISNRDGTSDIYVMPFSESAVGTPERVTLALDPDHFHLSNQDTKLVYSKGNEFSNIWSTSVNAPGLPAYSEPVQITMQNDDVSYLDIRKQDGLIAFDPQRGENRLIHLFDPESKTVSTVTEEGADYWAPTWSPDGSQLAFYSNYQGNRDIGLIPEHGGQPLYLTSSSDDEFSPSWSPDGLKITYSANVKGNVDLYSISTDGSEIVRLTEHEGLDAFPKWSPDGTMLAFTSSRTGDSEIWLIENKSGRFRQITESGGDYCAWSHDNRTIFFTNRADVCQNVFAVNIENGQVRQLTDFQSSTRQAGTVALSTTESNVYFTVHETIGDVWTMEVVSK